MWTARRHVAVWMHEYVGNLYSSWINQISYLFSNLLQMLQEKDNQVNDQVIN